MQAIGKNIVIETVKENGSTTKGGLLLAEVNREDIRYRKGKVINTGTEVVGVKNDDDIYYDSRAGFKIELEEKIYNVIKENDVVVVL
jgi:co-chaperonin GroES (HSP10)|tara:strand:+ start:278 stop:538 length:261 start_codon:yes stop_codon:yes gene_type:complete